MKQIYGKKLGMTRVFTESGESVGVTVIEVKPNVVCQVKTPDTDGYSAVQIGLGEQKPQRLSRAATGHVAKAKKGIFRELREMRLDVPSAGEGATYSIGDEISVNGMFQAGDLVDVSGVTVGKGYQGVVKRHGMKGNPKTRGTHEYRRHVGSIGCRKFPGRVMKNKRMPGHMGVENVTQLNLEVIAVRPEENLIFVRGSIPGGRQSTVYIRQAVKG